MDSTDKTATTDGQDPSPVEDGTDAGADHSAPEAETPPHGELWKGEDGTPAESEAEGETVDRDASVTPAETNTSGTMTDEELAAIVEDLETSITVVGCGGAGSNTVTRMTGEGIHSARLVAANTDAQHFAEQARADSKILLGRRVCRPDAVPVRTRTSARTRPRRPSRTSGPRTWSSSQRDWAAALARGRRP